jgi:MYXO-CTERM domain-containing protein
MYRIRRLTGGEVNLASMDELAAAIAAGTVTADAEIHHQRADRWLPIANHPHFRIAKDRAQSAARPAPKASPTPAPATAAPTLRLVRSDMGTAPGTTAETRPVSRWTPPQRSPAPTARPSGSAAPAMEPSSPTLEFVAEPTAPAPAEPVRPKRVEPATAGLPMLDIELPEPPRPMRAPTPMPAPISWPSMHTKARTEPAAPKVIDPELRKAPEHVPAEPPEPVMAAPSAEPVATVAPAPVPVVELAEAVRPAPKSVAIAAAAAPAVKSSMPWLSPEIDVTLDVPPPVRDFSQPAVVVEPEVAIELEAAGVAAPSSSTSQPSRWPMYAGALAVLGLVAFLALRPRSETETLGPKPAATPAIATAPTSTSTAADAPSGSTRPQITPIVPAGPSNAVPEAKLEPLEQEVVPAAPKLSGLAPANLGTLDVQIDPTASHSQRALEETRRQIDSQMRR